MARAADTCRQATRTSAAAETPDGFACHDAPTLTTSLTIGIDARSATENAAGRGRLVREVLRALADRDEPHRYVCYAREEWSQQLDERFTWRSISAPDLLWHWLATRDSNRRCDVFLATNSYPSVLLSRIPTVAIVYDLMTFDRRTSPNRLSLVIERLTLGAVVRHARRLVCISQATAGDLVARFPAARDRVEVALLGVSPALAVSDGAETSELPAPGFVLAVGTLEPRKNLPRLVEAYAGLAPAVQAAHPLVVVGARGWRTGPTLLALQSLGDRCILLGHVSDAALAELYRRSALFCYPSLGEGFGLPVLEAMAAGSAVVTSSVSSLPEVGGDAVEYVDPMSVASISAGMERVLGDPDRAGTLVARGKERAREFSWADTAATILVALESAAS
jgi:glycosyltransferase involved in cell wall biosynthesis